MTLTMKRLPGKRQEMVAPDLAVLTKALGEDVVRDFCRCFVSADRLTSLLYFGMLSDRHVPHDSVAHIRNLHTMHWFATGVLWEMKDALDALDKARVADLMADQTPWTTLKQITDRWAKNPSHRKVRNRVAFHVDARTIRKGLRKLSSEKDLVLVAGDDSSQMNFSAQIGLDALLTGMNLSAAERKALVDDIAEDLRKVPSLITDVFHQVLKTQKLL